MSKKISIIIPVYNEISNIPLMLAALNEALQSLPYRYNVIFVDDGSDDDTLSFIKQLAANDSKVNYLSFSRNFGHQNALKAGFDKSDADAVICMDGDMQHPPSLLPEMIAKWESGIDVVYTVRKDAKELTWFKRKTSDLFYHL